MSSEHELVDEMLEFRKETPTYFVYAGEIGQLKIKKNVLDDAAPPKLFVRVESDVEGEDATQD